MIAAVIEGYTRYPYTAEGFIGLAIREGREIGDDGPVPAMTSAWTPTPAELWKLAHGANVHISIIGTEHPPIIVEVGNLPDGEVDLPAVFTDPRKPGEPA